MCVPSWTRRRDGSRSAYASLWSSSVTGSSSRSPTETAGTPTRGSTGWASAPSRMALVTLIFCPQLHVVAVGADRSSACPRRRSSCTFFAVPGLHTASDGWFMPRSLRQQRSWSSLEGVDDAARVRSGSAVARHDGDFVALVTRRLLRLAISRGQRAALGRLAEEGRLANSAPSGRGQRYALRAFLGVVHESSLGACAGSDGCARLDGARSLRRQRRRRGCR